MEKYYLAIDLGASSGRHIVGYLKDGQIKLDEVYRFKTGMDESSDGLVWDIPRLLNEIIQGIKCSFEKYKNIESLAIDTWGVDYVLVAAKDGQGVDYFHIAALCDDPEVMRFDASDIEIAAMIGRCAQVTEDYLGAYPHAWGTFHN